MNYLYFGIIYLVYMNLHLNISQVQRTTPQSFCFALVTHFGKKNYDVHMVIRPL